MIYFTYPWMLWGLIAASLPWILRRRTPEKVEEIPFGLFQFLLESEPKRWLSRRAQELLLLVIRTLLLACLILAMAGPQWDSSASNKAAITDRPEQIVLIDRTPSMGDPRNSASAASRAIEIARELIEESYSSTAWDVWGWRGDLPESSQMAVMDTTQDRNILDSRLAQLDERTLGGELKTVIQAIAGHRHSQTPVLFITDYQKTTWSSLHTTDSAHPNVTSIPSHLTLKTTFLSSSLEPKPWVSFVDVSSIPWGVGTEIELTIRIHEPAGYQAKALRLRVLGPRSAEAPLIDANLEATSTQPEDAIEATRDQRLLIPVDAVTSSQQTSPIYRIAKFTVQLLDNQTVLDEQQLQAQVITDWKVGLLVSEDLIRSLAIALKPSTSSPAFFHPVSTNELLDSSAAQTDERIFPISIVNAEQAHKTPLTFNQILQSVEAGGAALIAIHEEKPSTELDAFTAFLQGQLGWSRHPEEANPPGSVPPSSSSQLSWDQSDALVSVLTPWAESLWRTNRQAGMGGETSKGQVLLSRRDNGKTNHLFARCRVGQGTVLIADLDLRACLRRPEFAPWLLESLKDLMRDKHQWSFQPDWTGERREPDPIQLTPNEIELLKAGGIQVKEFSSTKDLLEDWLPQTASFVGLFFGIALFLALAELLIGNAAA